MYSIHIYFLGTGLEYQTHETKAIQFDKIENQKDMMSFVHISPVLITLVGLGWSRLI